MDLDAYFKLPDSMSTQELANAIGVRHVAQVNQWRNPKIDRKPKPANCIAIERVTGGLVRRWDLRPDWHEVWPDLIGTKGAPKVKAVA